MIYEYQEIELATNWQLTILIIEHDENVVKNLQFSFEYERKFDNIFFADSYNSALEIISKNDFDVISSDYLFGRGKNGIEIFKDLKQIITHQRNLKKILYTQEDSFQFNDYERHMCSELGIEIVKKSLDHESLFQSIKTFYYKSNRLPSTPKYAFMNDKEFINYLSSSLVENLSKIDDQNELLSFTATSEPIKVKDLIVNIVDLTPLGKEYLGTWFSSLQRSIRVYEKQLKKLKNL